MATYYVGAGGNDASAGTSWGTRLLTLNGAEDKPVAAGDTVYVGPGTYRELLTVDVSGTAGNPISYIGDYTGTHTDGVGGPVRITGSADDLTATRANCITATAARNYRSFTGFTLDMTTGTAFNWAGGSNLTVDQCFITMTANAAGMTIAGAGIANHLFDRLYITGHPGTSSFGILFTHSATVDNTACVVQRCIFSSQGGSGIASSRIGGITVRNCLFFRSNNAGVQVSIALSVGQTTTVNNCIVARCATGFQGTTVGEITEDYNALFANTTNRGNTSTGANSNARPYLPEIRWFFETVNGGTLITPYDLASWCALVELNSGTGAPSTDMRGASVTGSFREWGPLEYNAALTKSSGSGGIVVSPLGQALIGYIMGSG